MYIYILSLLCSLALRPCTSYNFLPWPLPVRQSNGRPATLFPHSLTERLTHSFITNRQEEKLSKSDLFKNYPFKSDQSKKTLQKLSRLKVTHTMSPVQK